MGSRMVPLRLIYLSEEKYPRKTGCCAQQGTAPCFVIEFRNKDMTLALQATGITRRFPGLLANAHANFSWKEVKITLSWRRLKPFVLFIVGLYFCANRSFPCCNQKKTQLKYWTQWTFSSPKNARIQTRTHEMDVLEDETLESRASVRQ